MRMLIRAACAAVLVMSGAVVSVPAASAYWADITTDLPRFVTGPTPFTVTVTGGEPCRMTFEGQERTAPPWSFTYTPSIGYGWESGTVEVQLCDGTVDETWVRALTPFSVSPRLSSAENGPVDVWVRNETGEPGTVVIRNGQGKAVAEAALPADEVELQFRSPSKKPLVRYTAEVSSGPYRMTFPLDVMRGWSSYDRGYGGWGRSDSSLGNFEPCSTVKWSYQDKNRPSRTSRAKVLSDINGALKRLSAVTGLTFVRADGDRTAGDQVLTIGWDNLGNPGPAGRGGTSGGSSDEASAGFVTLNTKDSWAVNDADAGFGKLRTGPGGRGWLIVHELMHALGMDHTNDRSQLMYPVNYGQTSLGKGDLAGLRYLYPKKGC